MPWGDSRPGWMLMGFCFGLVGGKATGLPPPLPLQADRELFYCCPGTSPCPRWLCTAVRPGAAGSLIPLGICPSALLHMDKTQSLSPFPSEDSGQSPRSQGSQ